MKRLPANRLHGPLAALALAALTGASLIYWSHAERAAAEAELGQQHARLAQARASHAAAARLKAETDEALRQWDALQASGRLSPPDRHAWQRHVLAQHEQLGLDRLDWEIGPLHPLDDDAAHAARGETDPRRTSTLAAATLRLRGEIRHEDQLIAILERPPIAAQALILPRRCQLSRTASDGTSPTGSALAIDCEIAWAGLRRPTSTASPGDHGPGSTHAAAGQAPTRSAESRHALATGTSDDAQENSADRP